MTANTPSAGALSVVERDRDAGRSELCDATDGLLWLGASMLRAGSTAFRTRECMDMLAKKLSFDEISVALTLDSVIASARRAGEWITMAREIGLPGVNAWRIGELEQPAQKAELNPQKTAVPVGAVTTGTPTLQSVRGNGAERRRGGRDVCLDSRTERPRRGGPQTIRPGSCRRSCFWYPDFRSSLRCWTCWSIRLSPPSAGLRMAS